MKKLFIIAAIAAFSFVAKAEFHIHLHTYALNSIQSYVYFYNDNGADVTWPGVKMTQDFDGGTMYTATINRNLLITPNLREISLYGFFG